MVYTCLHLSECIGIVFQPTVATIVFHACELAPIFSRSDHNIKIHQTSVNHGPFDHQTSEFSASLPGPWRIPGRLQPAIARPARRLRGDLYPGTATRNGVPWRRLGRGHLGHVFWCFFCVFFSKKIPRNGSRLKLWVHQVVLCLGTKGVN